MFDGAQLHVVCNKGLTPRAMSTTYMMIVVFSPVGREWSMNMNTNRPNPSKAIHVSRKARRTPKGVSVCTTNVGHMTSRELRLLRDEIDGKAPEWTYDGVCYRPTGGWRDTEAQGEYVTRNYQEISIKRHVMYKQVIALTDVMTGNETVFENVIVSDISGVSGMVKMSGSNFKCIRDGDKWVVYV